MSYYVTHENSILNINNAHLKVSGNVMTDVMKLGAIEFAPPSSDVPGTVNFTNVTTGATTTSNLNVGGTLMLGSVEVVGTPPANTSNLHDVVELGNVTSNTMQFTNATTALVTTANVEVGGDLTVTANVEVGGTGYVSLPVGTTAQRPATVAQTTTPGMIRFNNTTYKYEGWGTSNWVDLSIADPPILYSFTSHTFTHCNGDSRYGPQLSDAIATYGNISPWNNTNFFNITTRGFQLWTVPKTGTYRITARGARGGEESSSAGSYNNTPGSGAAVRADFALTVNTQIVFIVGQTPPQSTGNYRSGSGGGATWVLKPGAYTNNDDVYMVAGGGGGAGPRHFNSGTAGAANGSSQGTLGGGGTSHWNYNGGGAGWTADGDPSGARGGVRPAGGAMGGTGTTHGGFGGGGSESGDSAGGGAGATGGRAALRYDSTGSNTARGGTSYITTNATNRSFLGNHGLTNGGNVYVELIS